MIDNTILRIPSFIAVAVGSPLTKVVLVTSPTLIKCLKTICPSGVSKTRLYESRRSRFFMNIMVIIAHQ